MKGRIIFTIVLAVILTAIHVFAQEKQTVPDSTITKVELIKKYEAEKQDLQNEMRQRVLQLLYADPQLKKRLDQLTSEDAYYNRILGSYLKCEEHLGVLKPKEKPQNKEVKK